MLRGIRPVRHVITRSFRGDKCSELCHFIIMNETQRVNGILDDLVEKKEPIVTKNLHGLITRVDELHSQKCIKGITSLSFAFVLCIVNPLLSLPVILYLSYQMDSAGKLGSIHQRLKGVLGE
jgi:hypothetical protein